MAQQKYYDEGKNDPNTVNDIATGVTYHLYPLKGLSTNNKYLSCTSDGGKVDLYHKDDNSGRQQWKLKQLSMSGKNAVYNITPFDGIFGSNKKIFSCTWDGKKVDLYHKDDGSGRQRWVFIPNGRDPKSNQPVFNIRVLRGVDNGRVWLSCTDNGKLVDLYHRDDGSGRQKWVVTPVDMKIVSIDYQLDAAKILNSSPMLLASQTLRNHTGQKQSMKFTVNQEVTNESTFNNTAGISVTVGTTFSAKVPMMGDSEISMSATASYEHSWGGSKSTKQSWSQEFPVEVDANKTVKAKAIVKKVVMDVPYVATLKSSATGKVAYVRGVWKGTHTYDIDQTITPM